MKSKYKILIQISLFLITIAVIISFANYYVSIKQSKEQLKTVSLPLSLNTIYTEIQKNLIQPYIVSSMMANDTFVQNWLKNKEQDRNKIIEYLSAVKNKYSMFSTFLVSDITKKYYTQKGFIEIVNLENEHNKWYFDFINHQNTHEINIDFNKNLSNSLIMFINHKILDNNYKFLGATGVALETQYINQMLKDFRQKYGFKVTFFNKEGEAILYENNFTKYKSIQENPILKDFKNKIISNQSNIFEIEENNREIIIHTKYIDKLHLYLTIEVNIDKYTGNSIKMFYFNLLVSLIIVLFIVFILYKMINKHNEKLETMVFTDPLTKLYNRRYLLTKINEYILHNTRNEEPFSLAFIDIDNFKIINDTKGHNIGDEVLKELSFILKSSLRETDTVARWGGEEIIVLFHDSSIENAQIIATKLKILVENNIKLKELLSYNLTVSIGITEYLDSDDENSIIKRADEAMYVSKNTGKNKVSVL